jgi:hypothetical protein
MLCVMEEIVGHGQLVKQHWKWAALTGVLNTMPVATVAYGKIRPSFMLYFVQHYKERTIPANHSCNSLSQCRCPWAGLSSTWWVDRVSFV